MIRSKVIAVLLGPFGMGISGLLNSTINTISGFTKLGLDTSAVKEISSAQASENPEKTPVIVASLKRLVWLIGILALVLTSAFSSLLSKIVFGNDEYTSAFLWISIALLFRQLAIGNNSILQGFRKLKYLAKSNLLGSFLSLLVAIPLYYIYGIKGIVPAIIASSIVMFLTSWFFSIKLKIEKIKLTNKNAFIQGKAMLKLGMTLSVMSIISLLTAYLVQIYISHFGGMSEVGFYMAGFVIINSYVGMIFNAMQTDYFPKLSAIQSDIVKIRKLVTEQAFVGLLLITPIIIIFLTTTPLLIKLLYSSEFLVISGMISWGVLGTLFKAISFSMGYVILAKSDTSLYLKTSIIFNSILLMSSLLGYHLGGLSGIGIGFLIYYFVHFLGVAIITYKKYDLYLIREFYRIFVICVVLCAITFLGYFIENQNFKYSLMITMSAISLIFTIYQLNKKMDILGMLKGMIEKSNDKTS